MILSEDSKTLFCSSKFPWARKRISSKFMDSLSTRPQKVLPALLCTLFNTAVLFRTARKPPLVRFCRML